MKILRELGFDYSEDNGDVFEVVKELAYSKGLDVSSIYVPRVVVLSLSVGITNLLIREFNACEVPWIYRARPLYIGKVNNIDIGIIWASPRAPLAAMVMKHLIACGAEYIIGIGLLASIQFEIDIGTIVIPLKAMRGEGTSYYYLPEDIDALPSSEVVTLFDEACRELGIGCIKGVIYTTDAIHRETRKLVEELRKRGIIGIDMETAAIFAVGMYRKVKTGCILITSTNPRIKSIGFYNEKLKEYIMKAIEIIRRAIPKINTHN